MILSDGFIGDVLAKVIKVYSPYDLNLVLKRIDDKEESKMHAVVSDHHSIGGWKYSYLSNNYISMRLVYNKYNELYETMDDNNFSYFVKIIKINK